MDGGSLLFWVLIATCLMHWLTVFLLLRRVHSTENTLVWKLLSAAVGLLAIQKTYGVSILFLEINPPSLNFVSTWLGFVIAGLLLGGIVQLSPFLYLLQRNKELLAVIEERNVIILHFHERIARALHKIQMAMEVGRPTTFIIEQVAEMSEMLQVFLENLKAGVLLGNKFEVALKTLVEDLSREASFPIFVYVDPSCEDHLSREQGAHLLHIVREAVRNSVLYSHAKRGQVSAKTTPTDTIIEVSDNGKGFEVDLVGAQGHGLGIMVNRAKKIGARLKIHSQPSKGTSVFIEVPFKEASSDRSHSDSIADASLNANKNVYVG
ncbi:sensor histidine kinase [Candidatus Nitrospira allomarina]|uniref:histidine kinase n=1 Tax=Candidatus Nitrospira allomarina TaxID=3020900 RepID=A0AA96GBJ1_9BACT|nr:ATP-binding protein [Candidatus Nitrospira allomarina]WNM56975.1 ATP-binding protein [Candidatus Nitrospira allomarina]